MDFTLTYPVAQVPACSLTSIQQPWQMPLRVLLQKLRRQIGVLQQQSPTFLAPGSNFVEDNFSMEGGGERGWFRDDSSALHLLYTLFL